MPVLPRGGSTRRLRVLTAVSGLLAVLALAGPSAVARTADAAAPAGGRQLASIAAALAAADVAGTAWYTDAASGKVVVTADRGVDARGMARLRQAGAAVPGALVVQRDTGSLALRIAGGQPIFAPGRRCTIGFNVRNAAGEHFALVAGHCLTLGTTWYTDPGLTQVLGPVVAVSFPGDDFGLIKYVDPALAQGSVSLYNGTYQDIVQAGTAYVGQAVKRAGPTTGVHSGTVTALNVTVNYGGGAVVSGLVRTSVCSEPGDSGGPFFSGTTAFGLASGGSGNCTSGGVTYYQPVTEALAAYGVTLL